MYDAGPEVAAAWRALFDKVFADLAWRSSGSSTRHPLPIESLWEEPKALRRVHVRMALRAGRAAHAGRSRLPVPSPPRYESKPRYCSDFLVREDSGWESRGRRVRPSLRLDRGRIAFGLQRAARIPLGHSRRNAGVSFRRASRVRWEVPPTALDALKSGTPWTWWPWTATGWTSRATTIPRACRRARRRTNAVVADSPRGGAPGVDPVPGAAPARAPGRPRKRPGLWGAAGSRGARALRAPDETAYTGLEKLAPESERPGTQQSLNRWRSHGASGPRRE